MLLDIIDEILIQAGGKLLMEELYRTLKTMPTNEKSLDANAVMNAIENSPKLFEFFQEGEGKLFISRRQKRISEIDSTYTYPTNGCSAFASNSVNCLVKDRFEDEKLHSNSNSKFCSIKTLPVSSNPESGQICSNIKPKEIRSKLELDEDTVCYLSYLYTLLLMHHSQLSESEGLPEFLTEFKDKLLQFTADYEIPISMPILKDINSQEPNCAAVFENEIKAKCFNDSDVRASSVQNTNEEIPNRTSDKINEIPQALSPSNSPLTCNTSVTEDSKPENGNLIILTDESSKNQQHPSLNSFILNSGSGNEESPKSVEVSAITNVSNFPNKCFQSNNFSLSNIGASNTVPPNPMINYNSNSNRMISYNLTGLPLQAYPNNASMPNLLLNGVPNNYARPLMRWPMNIQNNVPYMNLQPNYQNNSRPLQSHFVHNNSAPHMSRIENTIQPHIGQNFLPSYPQVPLNQQRRGFM